MNAKEGALIAGNWKSVNMTIDKAVAWADAFNAKEPQKILRPNLQLVLFPPMSAAYRLRQRLLELPNTKKMVDEGSLAFGGQDLDEVEGPKIRITGSHHPNLLVDSDLGMNHVLVGHSERRTLLGESDDVIAKKMAMAIKYNLKPILCVGENREQYEAKQTTNVIKRQLSVLDAFSPQVRRGITVAYEPVWAIGTGLTPTAAEANDACRFTREQSGAGRVLYGGSVTASNAAEFFGQEHIDGGLPGGASESALDFFGIAEAASHLL